MPEQRATILNDLAVRAALKQAWQDSHPGLSGGHEEGGFILRGAKGGLDILRWPKGAQSKIVLPPHPNCKIGEWDIIATFHTHPNTGDDFLQEPGETDRRAVKDDPDLQGMEYEGEFVVSQQVIYLITPTGQVSEVGFTSEIFSEV